MNNSHHHSHVLLGRPALRRRERATQPRKVQDRSMLASPVFWLGGAASLAVWAVSVLGVLHWR